MKMNKMYYCVMSLEHVLQMLLFKDIVINQNKIPILPNCSGRTRQKKIKKKNTAELSA